MVSIINPPQRIRLLKAVKHAFEKAGWKIESRRAESYDFQVYAQTLTFLIKCLDESRINYKSVAAILVTLESHSHTLRNMNNRQLIVVLNRNFLGIPLENLMDRDLFVITLEEISCVTGLAVWGSGIQSAAGNRRQQHLLERSIDYAISVSRGCRDQGDIEAAIAWGQTALRHSIQFSEAYMHLFGLLKAAGKLDAAAKLGQEICRYRPEDPQILRGMADLAQRRGDKAEAVRWTLRLKEQRTTPLTLDGILAKQRQQSGQLADVPREEIAPLKSGLARFFGGIGRRTVR